MFLGQSGPGRQGRGGSHHPGDSWGREKGRGGGGEEEVTFRHLQGRDWPGKVSHFRTPLRSSSLDRH